MHLHQIHINLVEKVLQCVSYSTHVKVLSKFCGTQESDIGHKFEFVF